MRYLLHLVKIITVSKNIKLLSSGEELISFSIVRNNIEFELTLNAFESWRNPDQLLDFALAGHSFGNSDSNCGITYESDLDEYDRKVDKVSIPKGYLQAYCDHFKEKEKNLSELNYLLILKSYFIAFVKPRLARKVESKFLSR
ncbi:MAG: hypothetical protein ACI8ZM_001230 [Crocinitomix sp.]